MKKTNLTILLAGLTALSIGLTAQASDIPEEYADREVVDYWYPWGGDSEVKDKEYMQMFNDSQDKYYVRGQYVPDNAGVTNGKLLAAVQSGDVPDVIISDNFISAYSLAVQGAFEPLDDALEEMGFDWSRVNESVMGLLKSGDGQTTYFFPHNSDMSMLFINNKMAEEAGLDVTNPPKTIDELDQWADALTKYNEDGSVETYGLIPWLDGGRPDCWGVVFGATVYDGENDEYHVDVPEMVDVYNWMRSYSEKYNKDVLMGFTSNLGGAFSPDHAFFTGDVAMTVNGQWFNEAVNEYAPDLDYSIVPMPAVTEDLYGGSEITGNVVGVPLGADNIQGALAWAEFLQKGEIQEPNNRVWLSLGAFPDTYQELSRVQENDPKAMMCIDIFTNPNSRVFLIAPRAAEVYEALIRIQDEAIYTDNDISESLKKLNDELNS